VNSVFNVGKAKIIAGGISIVGLAFSLYFATQINFSIRLERWFNQEYWVQFMPLVSSILLLAAGILALLDQPNANFTLALFGHTVSEQIMFAWLGLTDLGSSLLELSGFKSFNYPEQAIMWFFGLSLISLCVAYSNVLKLRPVSIGEAIIGIATGVGLSFFA
jgi:hypothetical protein